ncbi:MAG: hypothetical protein GXP25_12485 [Planctomycetes bacterium]|nr:hypothetical protein [Planctomycetota bacterium]
MRARISFIGVVFVSVVLAAGCRSFSSRRTPTIPPGKKEVASGVAVDIQEQIDRQPSTASIVEAEVIRGLRGAGIDVRAEGRPARVIMGEADANFAGESEVYGVKTSVYAATVSLRVIDKRTGNILAAASSDVRKMATEKQTAARGALRDAADRAMSKIIGAIPRPEPKPAPKPKAEEKKKAGKKKEQKKEK